VAQARVFAEFSVLRFMQEAVFSLAVQWKDTMTMHYLVTGATGFIAKRLVKKLLGRKGDKAEKGAKPQLSAEAIAMHQVMQAIHF